MSKKELELPRLDDALREVLDIPLWGSPPPFPWKTLSQELCQLFGKKSLSIDHAKSEWLEGHDLVDGMGEHPTILPISLSPLPGSHFLIIPENDQKVLLDALVANASAKKGFSSTAIQQGFFHFAALAAFDSFNRVSPYGNLTAMVGPETSFPDEGALSIDIGIQIEDHTVHCRFICSREGHAAFKTQFTMATPPLTLDESMQKTLVPLTLSVGSTHVTAKQLKSIHVGDLLLLDRCLYDLDNGRGRAILNLGSTPLFDVRIKGDEVKILEQAFYQEEISMQDESPPGFSDENLEPVPPPPPPLPPESPESGEIPPLDTSLSDDETPLWAGSNGGDESAVLQAAKKVPINIVVEAGRIKMPLEKLTQLQPGNVLDLSVNPSLGVFLTVEGKRIAKGELVRLGEVLGVKILSMGE